MVLDRYFEDIFESSIKDLKLTLPVYKNTCLKLVFSCGHNGTSNHKGQKILLPFAASDLFNARIHSWRRLTSKNYDDKPVYEISFNVKDSNFIFRAGDTIGVIPRNKDEEVNVIVNHLNLSSKVNLNYHLSIDNGQKGGKIPAHIPESSSLMHVLTYCLDLRSVAKKLFLLALSQYTKDETEKKTLEYLCSKEGSATYNTYILNKNICILDIFLMFPSCKPPIEVLLANLTRLLPRPYSITNSGLKDQSILKICFSVKDIGNNRKGLTTGWLEELILSKEHSLEERLESLNINKTDSSIPIYLRKNVAEFSLPESLEKPLLLVGSGTGVSPFVGFLEEREFLTESKEAGYVWLVFGCRNPQLDFLYQKEINNHLHNGTLNKLSTAFSRIENNGVKYVQDAVLQDGEEITKLIEKGGIIFVCGDLRIMASEVKENIVTCLIKYSGRSRGDAEAFVKVMEKEKRFKVDTWS